MVHFYLHGYERCCWCETSPKSSVWHVRHPDLPPEGLKALSPHSHIHTPMLWLLTRSQSGFRLYEGHFRRLSGGAADRTSWSGVFYKSSSIHSLTFDLSGAFMLRFIWTVQHMCKINILWLFDCKDALPLVWTKQSLFYIKLQEAHSCFYKCFYCFTSIVRSPSILYYLVAFSDCISYSKPHFRIFTHDMSPQRIKTQHRITSSRSVLFLPRHTAVSSCRAQLTVDPAFWRIDDIFT